nr:MAG TPA: Protein of unknown function (DUF1199) [Caudoviricetes sp.]
MRSIKNNFLGLTARWIGPVRTFGCKKYLQNPEFCLIFAHAKAIDRI